MKFKECYRGFLEAKDKRPIRAYTKLQSHEFSTLEEVKKYNEYVGILAKGIILVDVDDDDQGIMLWQILQDLGIDCPCIKTDNGYHFLFKNEFYKKTTTKLTTPIGIIIDIKLGDKNGIESLKKSGIEREIINDTSNIPTLPKFLYAGDKTFKSASNIFADGYGDRNSFLSSHKFHLYKLDTYTPDEIHQICSIINDYIFYEPLGDEEFKTIMREENIKSDDMPNNKFFIGKKFLHNIFATHLVEQHNIKRVNGSLCIYKDGIYVNRDNSIERKMVNILPELSRNNRAEVMDYINIICKDNKPDDWYIAFNNGLLNLKSWELVDYTKDIICINKIPHNYNPNISTVEMDTLIGTFVSGDLKSKDLLYEIVGYLFYPMPIFNKCFIIFGNKDNGKSKFLDTLTHMLGSNNVSHLEIKQLNEQFSLSMLTGKMANLGDDISGEYIPDTSIFKKIITGESIKVDKKYQHATNQRFTAKHIFCTNEIPRFKDPTGAIKKRVCIIHFDNDFGLGSPSRDITIIDKLTKQENIEALISLGLTGLERVLRNGQFTETEATRKALEEFDLENNPIKAFYKDYAEEENKEYWFIGKDTHDVYYLYLTWAEANGYKPVIQRNFTKMFKSLTGTDMKQVRKGVTRYRVYCLTSEVPVKLVN